jgi:hypothetical protein
MQTIDSQQIRAIAKKSGAKIRKLPYRRFLVLWTRGYDQDDFNQIIEAKIPILQATLMQIVQNLHLKCSGVADL